MKFFLRFLILAILFFKSYLSSAQNNIDVLHYKFDIVLNDQNDTIRGTALITFIFKDTTSSVLFDLESVNKEGKGMIVTNVVSTNNSTILYFKQADNKLIIHPDIPSVSGVTAKVTITYKGIPSDGLIISKNIYGDRTFFADNWPNRAHNWIPCIDDPADKASFEFTVTAPAQYKVISNGVLEEENDLPGNKKITHWKEDVPLSTKVMVIGVARFAVKEYYDSPPGIPVSAWVYPQDSVTGFRNYSVAPQILKYLSDYIGPYPYNKLANVQSKTIFGGMENASAIFYNEESAISKHTAESLFAHEITHQWFGDMATEKSFAHLWLSEGFATYMTHIYIESKYGTDSLNREMQHDRRQVINFVKYSGRPVVDSISPLMDLLDANSYQKGSWVLHMLRRELGDFVFHRIIRTYYEKYKGKNADTRDFQAVAEEVSKKNLDIFFNQWLYSPGIPVLHVSWNYNEKEKIVKVKVDQVQKNTIFIFPLEIQFESSEGVPLIKKIRITKASESFNIPVTAKPDKIKLDPETSLLFEGTTEELKN